MLKTNQPNTNVQLNSSFNNYKILLCYMCRSFIWDIGWLLCCLFLFVKYLNFVIYLKDRETDTEIERFAAS